MSAARWALHQVLHGEPEPLNLSPVVYQSADHQSKRRFVAQRRHCTMIHGDFKAANLFVNSLESDTAEACAVCDFQFTGPGLGAIDVCYLLFPDARADYGAVEPELLDWYYDRLGVHMSDFGKEENFTDYSKDLFILHYKLAQADLLAYMASSSGWVPSGERDTTVMVQVDQTLTKIDSGEVLQEEEYISALRQLVE